MFIIPFIYKTSILHALTIHQFKLLTIGGKMLWEEEDSFDIQEILVPNGLYVESPPILRNGIYFCKVNTTKTNLTDFYEWDEISIDNQETFCWRTFYHFSDRKDATAYHNWLPIPSTETMGPYSCEYLFDMIWENCIMNS
jgi:hypothetical protein